jgi:hypothetical protein
MPTILIQLNDDEVDAWRSTGPAAARQRTKFKRLGRYLHRETGRPVEIETYPENNPDYFDPRPTTLWRASDE